MRVLPPIVHRARRPIIVAELDDHIVALRRLANEGIEAALVSVRAGRASANGVVRDRDAEVLSEIFAPA